MDFVCEQFPTRFEQFIYLLKVLEFFYARFNEFGDDRLSVWVSGHKAHGHGRSLPFAVGMVLKKGIEVGHHGIHPFWWGFGFEVEAEFHLAIRNPATFLPDLFQRQKGKTHDEFMEGVDPLRLRWSTMIAQVRALNPDVPLTIWCDEDTPLIWPDVLQAVSGHRFGVALADADTLLATIMTAEGLARMTAYLAENLPASPDIRRGIVAAFLDKYADPGKIEMDLDMPGWTDDLVTEMTDIYEADVAQIARLPGLTFLAP